MTDFKISTDIPVPTLPAKNGKYPWNRVPIGGSFFVAGKSTASFGGHIYARKKHGEKWTMRTVTEDGVKGVRFWRLK